MCLRRCCLCCCYLCCFSDAATFVEVVVEACAVVCCLLFVSFLLLRESFPYFRRVLPRWIERSARRRRRRRLHAHDILLEQEPSEAKRFEPFCLLQGKGQDEATSRGHRQRQRQRQEESFQASS